MGQVDFAYMKTHCEMGRTNVTIYRMCFQKILDVGSNDGSALTPFKEKNKFSFSIVG